MSTSLFQAEDWVYVADSMGRLGQGYYKNRSNPNNTITPAEFESRRSQPTATASNNKEQNINNDTLATKKTSSSGLLNPTNQEGSDLSPWDNPIIGEQSVNNSFSTQAQTKKSPDVKPQAAPIAKKEPPSHQESENNEGSGPDTQAPAAVEPESKVICTELTRQGLMRQSERRACTIYALSRLPNSFMAGYHFWAVPYVRLMRKSQLATQLITPLVIHRTREVCHRLGLRKTGSILGKILCGLHDPLCCLIGHFVQKTDYSTLYKQETFL